MGTNSTAIICDVNSGIEVVIQSIPTYFSDKNSSGIYQNPIHIYLLLFFVFLYVVVIYFKRSRYKTNNLNALRDILVLKKALGRNEAIKWPSFEQNLLNWVRLVGFPIEEKNDAEKIYSRIAKKHLKSNKPDLLLTLITFLGFILGLVSSIFDFQSSSCVQTASSRLLFTCWFSIIFIGSVLIYNLLKSRWLSYLNTLNEEFELSEREINEKERIAKRDVAIDNAEEIKQKRNFKFQKELFEDSVQVQKELAFSLQEFSKRRVLAGVTEKS